MMHCGHSCITATSIWRFSRISPGLAVSTDGDLWPKSWLRLRPGTTRHGSDTTTGPRNRYTGTTRHGQTQRQGHNDITMKLHLSKDNFATIISVYAPTMTNPDENKEAFYNQLASVLSGIPCTDKLLLIGNFNARIGSDSNKWHLLMCKHGIGKCNSNSELLLALCSELCETYLRTRN